MAFPALRQGNSKSFGGRPKGRFSRGCSSVTPPAVPGQTDVAGRARHAGTNSRSVGVDEPAPPVSRSPGTRADVQAPVFHVERAQSVPKRNGTTRLGVARRGTNRQVTRYTNRPTSPLSSSDNAGRPPNLTECLLAFRADRRGHSTSNAGFAVRFRSVVFVGQSVDTVLCGGAWSRRLCQLLVRA